jgi:zinc finger CCHC domain-containing protein 9
MKTPRAATPDGKKKPMTKEERRAKYTLLHRARREKDLRRQKFSHVVCFHCRKKGHAVIDCPDMKTTPRSTPSNLPAVPIQICYKCGSTEHTLRHCTVRSSSSKDKEALPFASCFVCHEKGHLAGQCPNNEKGIYVNGGCCKECGSTSHLVTKCPARLLKRSQTKSEQPVFKESIEDLLEGDDTATKKDSSLTTTTAAAAATTSTSAKKPASKRKVVKF